MDRGAARDLAARIGASFPSSRVAAPTLDEWAIELQKLTVERGERVLEWLRDNLERAPSFKQLRAAMGFAAQVKRAPQGWMGETAGINDPCEFCQQPVTNGPDAVSRYDAEFDRWQNAHLSCADLRAEAHSQSDSPRGVSV